MTKLQAKVKENVKVQKPKPAAKKANAKQTYEEILRVYEEQQKAEVPTASLPKQAEEIRLRALRASTETQKTELLVQALNLYPALKNTWDLLFNLLGENETVVIKKTEYRKLNCLEKSLEIEPLNIIIWNNLGVILLTHSGSVARINDRTYTPQDCFIKVLEIDSNYEAAWLNLGTALGDNKVIFQGKEYNEKSCFERVLEINPRHAKAWYRLGNLLKGDETFTFKRNLYDAKKCYVESIVSEPSYYHAWYELARLLPVVEENPFARYKKRTCFEQVLRYKPDHLKAREQLTYLLELEQRNTDQAKLMDDINDAMGEMQRLNGLIQSMARLSGEEVVDALNKHKNKLAENAMNLERIFTQIKTGTEEEIQLLEKIEQSPVERAERIKLLKREAALLA